MKALVHLIFFLFCSLTLTAQVDSLVLLDDLDVTVRAFADDRPRSRVAGAVEALDYRAIQQFDRASLLPALNRLPGVRFEERAPGSYRISVRGSTLRSPFGVRNIKVYWNDIPFTQPGGDTPFNFLDLTNIDRLELLKGPTGSLYGAGNAGTLLLATGLPPDTASLGLEVGSFGLRRITAGLLLPTAGGNHQFRFSHQESEGYRDHAAFERQNAQYSGDFQLGKEQRIRLDALYTNLFYELPGGLNPEQYAENPRQARPGSETTNASINYDNLLFGATHEWKRGRLSTRTTLYGTFFYFDHPFNIDYKRETSFGGGGRGSLAYTVPFDRSVLRLTVGVEHQLQFKSAQNYDNNNGNPAELNFSDEILSDQSIAFGQATLELADNWRLTAGLSLNTLGYQVNRNFDVEAGRSKVDSDFGWVASPRLAALKTLGPVNVYGSISAGFSPPTLSEFRTNEGSINTSLDPERGVNVEIGIKSAQPRRLSYELTAFYFRLDETITSFQEKGGRQLFRNAGATDQRGIEASLNWLAIARSSGLLRELRYYAAVTYHDFEYSEYQVNQEDFSGQPLPGTAPFVTHHILSARFDRGFYADFSFNYTDEIPLNDANTVFGESYQLVRATLGWQGRVADRVGLQLYVGSDNLLDQTFSLGNDLNPQFGNRFFQPAPGRSWRVGLRTSL